MGLDGFEDQYPHQLSGGMQQRVGIARALASNSDIMLMDEAFSALDPLIRTDMQNLLLELQEDMGLTYLFIAHDLAVVKHISDHIAVMYLGRIVEIAPVAELFSQPRHPYTEALMNAVPVPDPNRQRRKLVLSGEIPSPIDPPAGCHFHPRCPHAFARCSAERAAVDLDPLAFGEIDHVQRDHDARAGIPGRGQPA